MTEAPANTAPKKTIADKAKEKPRVPLKPNPTKVKRSFFADDPIVPDVVANEQTERDHYQRLLSRIFLKTVIIAILAGVLVLFAPFFAPVYLYYACDTNKSACDANSVVALNGLTMPNMTNRAVLSWAVTSVTEVMTIGFGDLIPHLEAQKPRFTGDGWSSFVAAFHKQKINEVFKQSQLVLTTVPSDTAVILAQGPNAQNIYQWKVQVPVIMTYATNNNVSEGRHAVITLTIVRVPAEQSPSGIAVKKWTLEA